MQTVNIHEAKMHLSRLIEQVEQGEPLVISKAGKPLVKIVPLNAPEADEQQWVGFMVGEMVIPKDFDQMGSTEIEYLFGGEV